MTNRNNATTTNKGLWCKLSVDYQFDPKIMQAGFEAEVLFVRGMALAKRQDTAFIHRVSIAVIGIGLPNAEEAADRLCAVGLWEETDDGWIVVSFDQWQETDKTKSLSGSLGNHQRYCVNQGKPIPNCVFCKSPDSESQDRSQVRSHPESQDRSLEQSRVEQSRTEQKGIVVNASVEATHLCELLKHLMTENGCKPPTVTQAWLGDMDKLLRIDKRDPVEAEKVLRWCQADGFWRANIQSPRKFREQFDKLRLQMNGGARESRYEKNRRQIEENHRLFQAEAAIAFAALGKGETE